MKTIILISLLMPVILLSSQCQQKNENTGLNKKNKFKKELGENPKIDVKVNKEYDKNGNIIKYDSIYSYFYSNINDTNSIDTVFNNFYSLFEKSSPDLINNYFDNVFFNDSLLKYDFFKNDFFSKRFELNREYFNRLFWEMDSIKNSFFNNSRQNMVNKHYWFSF